MKKRHPEVTSMRMATVFPKSSLELDSARINSMEEYELIQNLYRPLVEYDRQLNLAPAAAESFHWEGNDLVFSFSDERIRTIDGHPLTAEDAARSLKRAIFYGNTGHGDLRTFLCPREPLKSINDSCPGIRVEGNRLVLTPTEPHLKSHLLKILESADYSIIPAAALDPDPKNPRFVSHRNTSGPYYVEQDSADGAWVLRINPRHYHFHPDMPQEIRLVPVDYVDVVRRFRDGDFDYISAGAIAGDEEFNRLLESAPDINVHESLPFRVRLICMNPRIMKEFTADERLYVAGLLAKFVNANSLLRGAKPTVEFFQALSEGTLSEEQRSEIQRSRSSVPAPRLKRPMTIGGPEPLYSKFVEFFKETPEIRVLKLEDYAFGYPVEKRPDVYVVTSDSAWTESLSLLGHNFNVSIFHLPDFDGKKWLEDYIRTESKESRLQQLKSLHFDLLKKAALYPVAVSPYYSVARKPWLPEFSTFSSGTELWQMRKER